MSVSVFKGLPNVILKVRDELKVVKTILVVVHRNLKFLV